MLYSPGTPAPVSYSFIDAGNLWQVLADFGARYLGGADVPVNWSALRTSSRKVFFYDAIPVPVHGEDENAYQQRVAPKLAQLASIERAPGFHVRTGDVRNRRKRGNEQKMVDVHFAVDALLMASRGLFHQATLVTGDLDFKPLVTALVELGVDVHLRYPRNATNAELIAAADHASPVTDGEIAGWIDQAQLSFIPPSISNIPRQHRIAAGAPLARSKPCGR